MPKTHANLRNTVPDRYVPTPNPLGFGVWGFGYSFEFRVSFGFVRFGFWVSFGFGGFGVLILLFFSDCCNEAIHRASQTSHNIARVKKTSLY
jgi:hypothetical protein